MSLLELMVVVVILGIASAMAVPAMVNWADDERVKGAARSVSDAFALARSEAIRTGNQHIMVFALGLGGTAQIQVIDDGPEASANCTIDAGELIHSVAGVDGVQWGTSTGAANGAVVTGDPGGWATGAATVGSTFTNAAGVGGATWVLFRSDGMPRTFTPTAGTCGAIGNAGEGGGGVYVTNLKRDYAVVLFPLGTTRVHKWNPSAGGWSN